MSKGILLLALNHFQYGKMAAGLAATIRMVSPDVDITLCCNNEAISNLSTSERGLFNQINILTSDVYTMNGITRPLRAKLQLPSLSPYDSTLYLDVDIAWLDKPVNELFEQMNGLGFCCKNYGYKILKENSDDKKDWAMASDILLAYNLQDQKNYDISSEIVYFEKTDQVKKLYSDALEIFDNPKITHTKFLGYMPDELPLQISMMLNNFYPIIDKWEPVYWRRSNRSKPTLANIRQSFYGLSMGGGINTLTEIEMYNALVGSAYAHLKIPYPQKWVNKKVFLKGLRGSI